MQQEARPTLSARELLERLDWEQIGIAGDIYYALARDQSRRRPPVNAELGAVDNGFEASTARRKRRLRATGELLDLATATGSQDSELPVEGFEHDDLRLRAAVRRRVTRREPFQCRCPTRTIDEAIAAARRPPTEFDRPASDCSASEFRLEGFAECAPALRVQLGSFGGLTRVRLLKQIRVGRKVAAAVGAGASPADLYATSLYLVERFVDEANGQLRRTLGDLLNDSRRQLAGLLGSIRADPADARCVSLVGHTRLVLPPPGSTSSRRRRHSSDSSLRLRQLSPSWSSSADSGLGEQTPDEQQDKRRRPGCARIEAPLLLQLDRQLKLRASKQVRSIIEFSSEKFRRLLAESPLFALSLPANNSSRPLSVQQMKVFVCVECQKLRAEIRFNWLEKCLLLAFGYNLKWLSQSQMDSARRDSPAPAGGDRKLRPSESVDIELSPGDTRRWLPPVELDAPDGAPSGPSGAAVYDQRRQLEQLYFDSLALILGRLLREQFLNVALARFATMIEHLLQADASEEEPPQMEPLLEVPVELEPVGGRGQLAAAELACSQPAEILNATMAFLVEELARVCCNLPRLETLLRFQGNRSRSSNELDQDETATAHVGKSLPVIVADDILLVETKRRVAKLIEAKVAQQGRVWIDPEYALIAQAVNIFRGGEAEAIERELAGLEIDDGLPFGPPGGLVDAEDGRAQQLVASCRQVLYLGRLELELVCRLARFFDLGRLVRLDCEPVRQALLRHVRHERLLLVRVKADELLRLAERLRLQLDEIELGCDLESSIEDYLAARWQEKQSQQPKLEHQVLLAAADCEMDDCEPDVATATAAQGDELAEATPGLERRAPGLGSARAQLARVDELGGSFGSTAADDDDHDDDDFVHMLTSQNPSVAHLFALNNSKSSSLPAGELAHASELRAPSLIECRLLIGCYSYFQKLVRLELKAFRADVGYAFRFGLVFLSEFAPLDDTRPQLEAAQLELIGELAARLQHFDVMLENALARLDEARAQLANLSHLRSRVLNRLLIEFDCLAAELAGRRFGHPRNSATMGQSSSDQVSIKQLDFIQQTSDWSKKLRLRLEFLARQTILLARERHLLVEAEFERQLAGTSAAEGGSTNQQNAKKASLKLQIRQEAQLRSRLLHKWRPVVCALARFWKLVEEFETQQVKWMNSDSKRINFEQIEQQTNAFRCRLESLRCECDQLGHVLSEDQQPEELGEYCNTLRENLSGLCEQLDGFGANRMPMFRFLTNRHLGEKHWVQLSECLLGSGEFNQPDASRQLRLTAQNYTTVAQLLELDQLASTAGANRVGQIGSIFNEISRQATVEHELGQLLLAEAERIPRARGRANPLNRQLVRLEAAQRLAGWSEDELALAASRFIHAKLASQGQADADSLNHEAGRYNGGAVDTPQVARLAVECHSTIGRYLRLNDQLSLASCRALLDTGSGGGKQRTGKVLRLGPRLAGAQQFEVTLLIEFLRLFADSLAERRAVIEKSIGELDARIKSTAGHMDEIDALLADVQRLNQVEQATTAEASEQTLINLERERLQLEWEREILASKDWQAQAGQREALLKRDECVRQISERAIPAIRAATRALDCLGDGACLRTLRSLRPSPPAEVRLVVEAVCLLRQSSLNGASQPPAANETRNQAPGRPLTNPQHNHSRVATPTTRRLDASTGKLVEADYWPQAWRILNGVHSCQFINDLRRLDKRLVATAVMQWVRRKYLAREEFDLRQIERSSPEAALLARWLIAVDVFNRVMNVVKPRYADYLESEAKLSGLFDEINQRRHQIGAMETRLRRIQESIALNIERRVNLSDLMDECANKASQMETTRRKLAHRHRKLSDAKTGLESKRDQLVNRCFLDSIELVYLDALKLDDDEQTVKSLIERAMRRDGRGCGGKTKVAGRELATCN